MAKRTCSVDGCDRKHLARGYCRPHLGRWQRNGDPGPADVLVKVRRDSSVCAVDGCVKVRSHRDWCIAHYARLIKHGDVGPAEILDRSTPRECAVEACKKKHDNNGYCAAHAHRLPMPIACASTAVRHTCPRVPQKETQGHGAVAPSATWVRTTEPDASAAQPQTMTAGDAVQRPTTGLTTTRTPTNAARWSRATNCRSARTPITTFRCAGHAMS